MKLPFNCLYCKEEMAEQPGGQKLKDYVVYLGPDFLKGSTVCVSVDEKGKKTLPDDIFKILD